MKNLMASLLLVMTAMVGLGQGTDVDKMDELEFMVQVTYGATSQIFLEEEQETKIDKDYELPWKAALYSNTEIQTALDTLVKNATISIKEGHFSNHILEFTSYFPEFIEDGLTENFKLSLKNSTLKDGTTPLDIDAHGSTGYGFNSSSGFKNGSSYSHNWRTMNSSFDIKNEIKTDNFEGSAEFESGFVNGYEHVRITSSDIGRKMNVGDHEFTFVDVFNNSVVLDFHTDIEDVDFSMVNVNEEGHRIVNANIFSSQTAYETTYRMFKDNPSLSLEDYKKVIGPKFEQMLENPEKYKDGQEALFGEKLHIFSSSGKLIKAYLYMPKYATKSFKITYDKDAKVRTPQAPKMEPTEEELRLAAEKEAIIAQVFGDDTDGTEENAELSYAPETVENDISKDAETVQTKTTAQVMHEKDNGPIVDPDLKVKVKKDDIFVNKVKIGRIEKIKTEQSKYLQVSDAEGAPLLKVKTISIPSPLFHTDHVFKYSVITGDKVSDTLAIDSKGFYVTQKRVAKYLVQKGFLDANGFNAENTAKLAATIPRIPEDITERIAMERDVLQDISFREQRQFSHDPQVFLEIYEPIPDRSIMTGRPVNSTKFDIFQDVNGDHVLIGYGFFEFSEIAGAVSYEKFFVVNARKVPLASYDGNTYKRYVNYHEYGLGDHDFRDSMSRPDIIKGMAVDLIKRKEL